MTSTMNMSNKRTTWSTTSLLLTKILVARTAYYYFIICLALPISSAFEFNCDKGQALVGFSSLFSSTKNDRIFYNHSCQDVVKDDQEFCQIEVGLMGSLVQRGNWRLSCKGESYVRGFNTSMGSDGIREYQMLCCQSRSNKFLGLSCFNYGTGLGDPFDIKLEPGQAFKGLRSVYDVAVRDRTYLFQICSFHQPNEIKEEAYTFYSLSQSLPFGDAANDYEFGTECVDDKFIVRLDSLWSHRNMDRAVMAECGPVPTKEPLRCLRRYKVFGDGETNDRNDILPPKDWIKSGCEGQEVMQSFKSKIVDDIRRYEFGCCILDGKPLYEQGCVWKDTKSQSSFMLNAPKGFLIRSVRAHYHTQSRDRNFRFEFCPLKELYDDYRCAMHAKQLKKKSKTQVIEVFMHLPVVDLEECARKCDKHPFCLSAGYYQPPAPSSLSPTCLLSYRRPPMKCDKNPGKQQATVSRGDDTNSSLWLSCIQCP